MELKMGTAVFLPLLFACIDILWDDFYLQNILEILEQSLVFACFTRPRTNYSCLEFLFPQ